MPMFECPHCNQPAVTFKQKLLAGKWIDVICAHCGGRSCIYPALLVVLYFFYTWDVMLFGYLTVYQKSVMYLGVMIGGWLLLEAFGLSLPLVRMKAMPSEKDAGTSPT